MQDWARLARAVVTRRQQLGFTSRTPFADKVGVSLRTLGSFERGERRLQPGNVAKLEQALRWRPGSASMILAGGEADPMPEPTDAPAGADGASVAAPIGELLRSIALVRRQLGDEAARTLIRGAFTEPAVPLDYPESSNTRSNEAG